MELSFEDEMRRLCNLAFKISKKIYTTDICIEGVKLRISSHDPILQQVFTDALTHHETTLEKIDFHINIWNPNSFDFAKPSMPADLARRIIKRKPNLSLNENILIDYDPAAQLISLIYPELKLIDVCISDLASMHPGIVTDPLRGFLSWLFKQHDKHLIHSASVCVEAGAALFLGLSGAGKSSTALRCCQGGMHYIGDDTCGISLGEVPYVFNLYGTAKVVNNDRNFFNTIPNIRMPKYIHKRPSKSLLSVAASNEISIAYRSNIKVLVLVDKSIQTGIAVKVLPQDIVKMVALSSYPFMPGQGVPLLSALRNLVDRIPAIRISLNEDQPKTTQIIKKAIECRF